MSRACDNTEKSSDEVNSPDNLRRTQFCYSGKSTSTKELNAEHSSQTENEPSFHCHSDSIENGPTAVSQPLSHQADENKVKEKPINSDKPERIPLSKDDSQTKVQVVTSDKAKSNQQNEELVSSDRCLEEVKFGKCSVNILQPFGPQDLRDSCKTEYHKDQHEEIKNELHVTENDDSAVAHSENKFSSGPLNNNTGPRGNISSGKCSYNIGSVGKSLGVGHHNTWSLEKSGALDHNLGSFNNFPKYALNNNSFSPEKPLEEGLNNCEFCSSSSKFLCKVCCYLYCSSCLQSLHPKIGPYKEHEVVDVKETGQLENHKRCTVHGMIAGLYCSYCEQQRCLKCANTKCFLHFKGKISEADIELAKKRLMSELEKATKRLKFVFRYKETVQNELEKTLTTAQVRKEYIRQEFVSFHHMLLDKEEKILQALEEDTQARVKHIKDNLEVAVRNIEKEEAELTTLVTDLVQNENTEQFLEEHVKLEESCHRVNDLERDFYRDWAKHYQYRPAYLLDQPFCMFNEKKDLAEKLDRTLIEGPVLRAKQTTLFLATSKDTVRLEDYFEVLIGPPSTDFLYTVQVFWGRSKLYEVQTPTFKDITLNTGIYSFVLRGRYLVKVTSSYKSHEGTLLEMEGNSAHLLIVVPAFVPAVNPVGEKKIKKTIPKIRRYHFTDLGPVSRKNFFCESGARTQKSITSMERKVCM